MAARTPRVVFSNTDFAKLDREDKEGRALFQRVVTLTFADRDVQIETKLRQSRVLRDELARTERQRDELSRQVRGKPLHPPPTTRFMIHRLV